jgi:hypothetical protein
MRRERRGGQGREREGRQGEGGKGRRGGKRVVPPPFKLVPPAPLGLATALLRPNLTSRKMQMYIFNGGTDCTVKTKISLLKLDKKYRSHVSSTSV